jgi:hypothetical protein
MLRAQSNANIRSCLRHGTAEKFCPMRKGDRPLRVEPHPEGIEAENREYEGTLLFQGVDPDNDQELAALQTDAMTNRDAE